MAIEIKKYYGDDKQQPEENGLFKLEHQTDYVVKGDVGDKDVVKGGYHVFRFISEGVGILNFKNFVGKTELFEESIEVKIKGMSPDIDIFDKMLREITKQIANLPFDFNTPTYSPFDRTESNNKDVLYHKFVYLQHILKRTNLLEGEFNEILANPHRKMTKEIVEEDINYISNFTPLSIESIFSMPRNLVKVENNLYLRGLPLTKALNGYFPQRMLNEKLIISYDTPENRFVKYFFKHCLLIVDYFRSYFEKEKPLNAELEDTTKEMYEKLEAMMRAEFLSEVGELTTFPMTSQVLQKRNGYRQILTHFFKLNLASSYPIDKEDYKEIIENKDVAKLYEYWVFFKMVSILEESCGKASRAYVTKVDKKEVGLRETCIKFDKGVNLFYHKTYSGGKESYSLNLQPDITLEITGEQRHLFDAKFKMKIENEGENEGEDKDKEVGKEKDVTQPFKSEDIHKMHTYRDAIDGVKSAWVVYPGKGNEFEAYNKGKDGKTKIEDAERINSKFEGVGAIPLTPSGEDDNQLKNVIKWLLFG